MKAEPNRRLDTYRKKHPVLGSSPLGARHGYFEIPRMHGTLRILSSGTPGEGQPPWEHVSISYKNRDPSWEDMCFVKALFWRSDETVIQFHPPESEYVNDHPHCLHLWRNTRHEHALPPAILLTFPSNAKDVSDAPD